MAYSKVSLICGLVVFLVISNGVSARLLDGLLANILMDAIHEEHKLNTEKKGTVDNGNTHETAPAPAQLPSEKSFIQAVAPSPFAADDDGGDVDDDDTASTGEDPQAGGVGHGDEDGDDDENDPNNYDGGVPLP